MPGISAGDGFVEVTENLAEMIKFVANEPSVGLFYIQQHTQNAAPNLMSLKNVIVENSHETALHAEDLEDSIPMVRSMKQCGFPIADEMIGEIKRSLSIMSSRKPKQGLIQASSSPGFLTRARSWTPSTWGRNGNSAQQDNRTSSGYLSSVFMSAKQRANDFKWAQVESAETSRSKGEESMVDRNPVVPSAGNGSSLIVPDAETDNLPLLSRNDGVLEELQPSNSLPQQELFSLYENYEEFKADREAKLEQWLGSPGKEASRGRGLAR